MGLTHFPHGILATPTLGVGRLIEMFESDNIWFVDGDSGSAGNAGNEPDAAVTLPSQAVAKASAYGTIYIKPRWTTACADVNYEDNITIPLTKPGISLIGAGRALPGYRGAAQITGAAESILITVNSSNCTIENLQFNDTYTVAYPLIYAVRSATAQAVSLQVRGCRIMNGDSGGAIYIGSCQYSLIEDNLFFDNQVSVRHFSVYGSPQSCIVRNNYFCGLVAQRDMDVWWGMLDVNSRGQIIQGNVFSDGLPNAGDSKRFIRDHYATVPGSSATGMICGNYFAKAAGTYKTDGNTVTAAAGMFLVGNYGEPTAEDLTSAADHIGRTS